MTGMYGADIVQLRALAAHFDRAADQLDTHRTGVGVAIRTSAWQGPDAGTFRYKWDCEHAVRVSAAAQALRLNAQRLRANADEQERTSAVDAGLGPGPGPGWSAPPDFGAPQDFPRFLSPDPGISPWRDTLDWIEGFKDHEIAGTGWKIGDLAALVPVLGSSSDLLGAMDKISDGKVPWHEFADFVAGGVKSAGPIGYGIGVNLALWSDVIEQGAEVDWSPKGMQDAFNGALTLEGWQAVGHDLATKLPAMLAGDLAWW